MAGFYTRNYWKAGFASCLYDLLTPEAYIQSLRDSCALVPDVKGQVWFDAGCGSGLLIPLIEDRLRSGGRYLGADRLAPGLAKAKGKAKVSGLDHRVSCFQADLTQPLPFSHGSVDIVFAHFSVYTLGETSLRRKAIGNFREILKPGGILVMANPSREYDAQKIIQESQALVRVRKGRVAAWVKRWLVYPWSLHLGLKFVERKLRGGEWHAYRPEEILEEVRSEGFEVEPVKTVYAGSGYLIRARKNSAGNS